MATDAVKRSVALAIHHDDGRVLLVQRPPDDEDLPHAWGLPAASLMTGESWEEAVRRAARDKLGVDVEPGRLLRRGSLQRAGYRLYMRLFEARILPGGTGAGRPAVGRPAAGVTQYVDWCWGDAARLRPAAEAGSLCSRLYLAARPPAG